ncbi:MAG: three-Cys-motif partner protein TcmP [bacterium]
MSSTDSFWDKQREESRIKSEIAVKYFCSWASIMKTRCKQLTYLDLFSGRGRYKDEKPSTPLLILNEVYKRYELQKQLRAYFYEDDKINHDELKQSIEEHHAYSLMHFRPEVNHQSITRELIPELPIDDCTFCFIDPWGYKGVSLDLLESVTHRWGCDSLFYISISGVQRNLRNPSQQQALQDLFGTDGLKEIQAELSDSVSPKVSETIIMERLRMALKSRKVEYFLEFGVEYSVRKKTSHFLVFISRHSLAFKIMKEIMATYSLKDKDGVPLFRYGRYRINQIEMPFHEYSIEKLKNRLQSELSGSTLSVKEVYNICHKLGYRYIESNIKDALLLLEEQGDIVIDLPRHKRREKKTGDVSLGKSRIVTFRNNYVV